MYPFKRKALIGDFITLDTWQPQAWKLWSLITNAR